MITSLENFKQQLNESVTINESLPPTVFFSDMEVFFMIENILKENLNNEQSFKLLRNKIAEKRGLDPNTTINCPPGAFM